MKDYFEVADDKNPKVFKHVHGDPEVPKHKRRWDSSKCKRNKGKPHDVQLVKTERADSRLYRHYVEGDEIVHEHRKTFIDYKTYECVICGKDYSWTSSTLVDRQKEREDNAYGEWIETVRRPYRQRARKNGPGFRKSSGYRKKRSK